MPPNALTPKQARFVDEYLLDLNATQAAIRAGYARKTAEAQSSRLLRNVKVKAAIDEKKQKRAERVEVKQDDILRELLIIGRTDIAKAFDKDGRLLSVVDMPEEVRRAISGIEVDALFEGSGRERVEVGTTTKVKFWDKVKGLELLGKHLQLFTDRIEHSGSVSIRVVDPYAKPQGEKE